MSWNSGFTAGPPLTEKDATEVAETLGLKLGTSRIKFAGSYRTKGLYSYKTGRHEGVAFFGQGGSDEDKTKALDDPKYRPKLITVTDPDDDYPADPDDEYPADPDDEYPAGPVAELPASKPKPVTSKGVRAENYPGSSPKALDVTVKKRDGSSDVITITSDMTVGELQAELTAKTNLMPGQLSLVLDEDDPFPMQRTPFLTPLGESMDRRSVAKDSDPAEYTRSISEGFSESKTSGEGGSDGYSGGIAGSFGGGELCPVEISATVGSSFTSDSTWSMSESVTVTSGREETQTFYFDAGFVTQYYRWAIMLPDGNNNDRVFNLPDDGYTCFRDYKGPKGKTVQEINNEQKNRVTVKLPKSITTAPTPKPKVWFHLKNKQGNYLSCPGNEINTRKPLYINQKYESQAGQMWSIEPIEGQGDNAGVRIKSKLTYKGKSYYMCVYGGKTHNGAHIGLWQQAGVSSQAWRLGKDCETGGGYITHARSDKVLATYRGHSILYQGKNEDGQRWELEYVE